MTCISCHSGTERHTPSKKWLIIARTGVESSFLKACWEMRASEGEAKNSLLYSLERSSKISSVLYKDSQCVLENLQVVGKFLSPSLSMVLFAESNPSEDYYYLYCHLNFCLYTCSVSADKHLLICLAETVLFQGKRQHFNIREGQRIRSVKKRGTSFEY